MISVLFKPPIKHQRKYLSNFKMLFKRERTENQQFFHDNSNIVKETFAAAFHRMDLSLSHSAEMTFSEAVWVVLSTVVGLFDSRKD